MFENRSNRRPLAWMTTSGASAVTTTGSHCQLTDSWSWICGIFILYILSFYTSEMDNVSSANGKQQMALKAVVGFWTALARVESNRALIATGWRRESSTAAGIAKKRRSLSPTISTGSEDVWNLACFGNDSQNSCFVFFLFFISFFSFQTVSRSSSPEGPWGYSCTFIAPNIWHVLVPGRI